MQEFKWSKTEKEAARRAYERAYEKECSAILARLKGMIEAASAPRDIWRIHDYLSQQRRQTDSKYDYRYSVLIWVFARLLSEGWLSEADLSGLDDDKVQKIKLAASM
jgi:hypothetical protein